jgi:hypothetical protein
LQKFSLIAIILCDATELISVAVDAKILVVKRGIRARYAPGFAGVGCGRIKRGNFSEKFRFYGEIFAVNFSRAASVAKFKTKENRAVLIMTDILIHSG